MLSSNWVNAYSFEPELVTEMRRVVPIYEAAVKSPDTKICSLNLSKTNSEPNNRCEFARKAIPRELQCIKNAEKNLRENKSKFTGGSIAFIYFGDNEGYGCFTEGWMFYKNDFGTEVGQARIDFFNVLQKHSMVK